jgi:hypothetical protein
MATPGKSAPEALVGQLVERVKDRSATRVEESTGTSEPMTFGLSRNLGEAPSYPQGV